MLCVLWLRVDWKVCVCARACMLGMNAVVIYTFWLAGWQVGRLNSRLSLLVKLEYVTSPPTSRYTSYRQHAHAQYFVHGKNEINRMDAGNGSLRAKTRCAENCQIARCCVTAWRKSAFISHVCARQVTHTTLNLWLYVSHLSVSQYTLLALQQCSSRAKVAVCFLCRRTRFRVSAPWPYNLPDMFVVFALRVVHDRFLPLPF
jgi:hypothetical protein